MNEVSVHVGGRNVGTLSKEGSKFVFTYQTGTKVEDFVSLTMPVRSESWVWEGSPHPFFQMNIPEGYSRQLLERKLSTWITSDPIALLGVIGQNMIGRVTFYPTQKTGSTGLINPLNSSFNIQDLIENRNAEAAFQRLLEGVQNSGVSGVVVKALMEEKIPKATLINNNCIIKGTPSEMPFAAINEHLCLKAVRRAMPAAKTQITMDGKCLVIERFDRSSTSVPMGMEDFCSLMGNIPGQKYDTTWEKIIKSAKYYIPTEKRHEFFKKLLKLFFFSYALRNGDCHSKNIALLYSSKQDVDLSPVYDMLTTQVFPNAEDNPPGLTIGGKKTWSPGKSIIKTFVQLLNIHSHEQNEILGEVIQATADTIPDVKQKMEEFPEFKEMGQKILHTWNDGVNGLIDKKTYSLGRWIATPEIEEIDDSREKSKMKVIGVSEGLGVRGKRMRNRIS